MNKVYSRVRKEGQLTWGVSMMQVALAWPTRQVLSVTMARGLTKQSEGLWEKV